MSKNIRKILTRNKFSVRVFILVFILSILWEIFSFLNFPKQAWIQGLVEAWFVSNGLFFYKDFGGTYTPLLRMLMVPYHSLFGYTQTPTILLAPIISIATLSLLFYAGLRFLRSWYRILPLVFFAIWNPFLGSNHFTTTSFLGLMVLITLVVWFSWQERPKVSKAFLFGLLCSICILTFQISIPFIGILLLLFFVQIVKGKNSKIFLKATAIGFLIPVVFVFFTLVRKNALTGFFYWAIFYHFTNYPYSSLGRGLEDVKTFLSIHSPLILTGYVILLVYKLKEKNNVYVFSSIFLFISVLVITFWFAVFHPLRFQISLPILSFILGLGVQEIGKHKAHLRLFGLLIIAVILWFNAKNVYEYVLPKYEEILSTQSSREIVSYLYEDDPMYNAVVWVKENTPDNARIFVFGDLLFYLDAGRLISSARGASNFPSYYEPFDQFLKEIIKSPPDYWVIDERNFRRFKEFGYGHLVPPFQKLLDCQEVIARFDYWTIRKHVKINPSCLL